MPPSDKNAGKRKTTSDTGYATILMDLVKHTETEKNVHTQKEKIVIDLAEVLEMVKENHL